MENPAKSDRISELARYCKRKYNEADLEQHNWEHITRNIYRAEKIAETEEDVDMEVLYAATMLHDIGTTIGEYRNHDENSRKLAREKLPDFRFSEGETEKIVKVLKEFAEDECKSIESKILSDADKLEKSSLASVFNTYKVAKEFGKEIEEMLDDLSKYQRLAEESGFYTEKAQEMDDGGLKERYEFLKDLKKRFDEREDFPASEKDLKLDI